MPITPLVGRIIRIKMSSSGRVKVMAASWFLEPWFYLVFPNNQGLGYLDRRKAREAEPLILEAIERLESEETRAAYDAEMKRLGRPTLSEWRPNTGSGDEAPTPERAISILKEMLEWVQKHPNEQLSVRFD